MIYTKHKDGFYFNKDLCFTNIRKLLRQNPSIKIGQIEKEAGFRPGYLSRLEKDGNTTAPSVKFVFTAAKLLNVSVDTLVSVNLELLTPTEQCLVRFFDKLKADTLADKLNWNREAKFNLNRIVPDTNGIVQHPLFAEETIFEESGEVTRIVFKSNTFGSNTVIAGDCYNLRLKNGITLYLMDIENSSHRAGDSNAYAKEAWVSIPHKGSSLLVASQDNTPIAPLIEALFTTVKDRTEHPKINKEIKDMIDAFLADNTEDAPN